MRRKFHIPKNTIGVYVIKCKINNKRYVGASVEVSGRLSQHFANRTCEKYKHLDLYSDILEYGFENFEFGLLSECSREGLLNEEQKYYDLLNPEYNIVRPCENMFKNSEVTKRASNASNDENHVEARKIKYNSTQYVEMFRTIHVDKMKPVEILKDGIVVKRCISLQEASRWITENTKYVGKNKTIKIKMVCDGERKNAYGYNFRYSTKSVTTIPKGSTVTIDT